jgi:uncharacterized protein YjiS (DUF1127 family)
MTVTSFPRAYARTRVDAPLAAPAIGTTRLLVRAVRVFMAWRHRAAARRQLRTLMALDDNLLRDIGLTRSELHIGAMRGLRE